MTDIDNSYEQVVTLFLTIQAPADRVWAALTRQALMVQWMSIPEIEVLTNWEPGSPFVIRGDLHGLPFENKGTVLQFEPLRLLRYTHLSSLSELADEPGNYCQLEFRLETSDNQTELILRLSNFPTASIYHHFVFYWNVASQLLKRFVEGQSSISQ